MENDPFWKKFRNSVPNVYTDSRFVFNFHGNRPPGSGRKDATKKFEMLFLRHLAPVLQRAPKVCKGRATWPCASLLNFLPLGSVISNKADFYRATLCYRGISCHRVSVRPSVRLSVCLSVTSRNCTKMAKPRIRLTTAYDSPDTLVLRCQKSWRNSNDITPNGGAK